MRKSELSTFPPSSPSPDGSHGKTKPCPKNVTQQPHRKGLKKQMNFCRDQMKCEVTLRERSEEEGSVREKLRGGPVSSFGCLTSLCLAPKQHTICQPSPVLYPSYRNTIWGRLHCHPPTFLPQLSPLCVTRRSKAEVCVLFIWDKAALFFSNLRESFLHLDTLPTGCKPYQKRRAITRTPDPDSNLRRVGSTEELQSSVIFLHPGPQSLLLIHCSSVSRPLVKDSELLSDPFLGTRQAPWVTVPHSGLGFFLRSPFWPPSTTWLPGTSKLGTTETPMDSTTFIYLRLQLPSSITQEKTEQVGRVTKQSILRWKSGGKHNREDI